MLLDIPRDDPSLHSLLRVTGSLWQCAEGLVHLNTAFSWWQLDLQSTYFTLSQLAVLLHMRTTVLSCSCFLNVFHWAVADRLQKQSSPAPCTYVYRSLTNANLAWQLFIQDTNRCSVSDMNAVIVLQGGKQAQPKLVKPSAVKVQGEPGSGPLLTVLKFLLPFVVLAAIFLPSYWKQAWGEYWST